MKSVDEWLRLSLEWTVSSVLALIALICFVEVILRYVFGSSFGWYDEFVGYLLVWLTFTGAVMAQQRGAHIGIENFLERLPPRLNQGCRMANHLILIAVHVVLLVYGTQLARGVLGDRATTLPVPMAVVYAIIPASACLMLFVEFRRLSVLFSDKAPLPR